MFFVKSMTNTTWLFCEKHNFVIRIQPKTDHGPYLSQMWWQTSFANVCKIMIFPWYVFVSLLKAYNDFILKKKTEYVLFQKDIKIMILKKHIIVIFFKIIIFPWYVFYFFIKKSISWFYFDDLKNRIRFIKKKQHDDYVFCQINDKHNMIILWKT